MKASALATLTGGRLHGPDREFAGVAPLEEAGPSQAAYAVQLPRGQVWAGVVLAPAPVEGVSTVVVSDPRLAFARLLRHLFPEEHPPGVQPGAYVHPTARLGEGASIYPGAYVGPEVVVGEGTAVLPNAVLLRGVRVGRGCIVGPGAVLGHAGFGVQAGAEGLEPVPQVGDVVIEDHVGIGANTCVDRAFLRTTRVGARAQLDNLVQVGHNCDVGRNVVMAAQVGLSGSVTVGEGAVLAGQVGVSDHVSIGPGAQVGGQAGVHRALEGGQRWMGTPALPLAQASRVFAAWKKLPELLRRVRRLETLVEQLINPSSSSASPPHEEGP